MLRPFGGPDHGHGFHAWFSMDPCDDVGNEQISKGVKTQPPCRLRVEKEEVDQVGVSGLA